MAKREQPSSDRNRLQNGRSAMLLLQAASAADSVHKMQLIMLAVLGIGSALLYSIGLVSAYPLLAGLHFPRGTWTALAAPTASGLIRHVGMYILVTLFYILAIRQVGTLQATRKSLAIIVGCWLLGALVLFGVYPGGESHDIFDYIFRGRMLAEYQASPLAIPPKAFAGAPYYEYISWYDHVDTYGPLWEYTSASIAATAGAGLRWFGNNSSQSVACPESAESCVQFIAYILAYRLFAVFLAGVCGALIHTMVRRYRPEQAHVALLAWLWNPLLLVSTAVGAHNEILAVALILAGLSFIQQRHWLASGFVLIFALHVKLTALLFLPALLVWYIWHVRWQHVLRNVVFGLPVSLLLSWLLYIPLGGWATLPRMLDERSRYLANSLASLANRLLREVAGWPSELARQQTITGASFFFGLSAILILMRLWRNAKQEKSASDASETWQSVQFDEILWHALGNLTLIYLIIGSFWFQHWYLIWIIASAALLPTRRFTRLLLPFYCCGALTSNVVGDFVYPYLVSSPYLYSIITALVVLSTLLPLLIALVSVRLLAISHQDALHRC